MSHQFGEGDKPASVGFDHIAFWRVSLLIRFPGLAQISHALGNSWLKKQPFFRIKAVFQEMLIYRLDQGVNSQELTIELPWDREINARKGGARRDHSSVTKNFIRQRFAHLGCVERIVVKRQSGQAIKFLAFDVFVEIDFERPFEGAAGTAIG